MKSFHPSFLESKQEKEFSLGGNWSYLNYSYKYIFDIVCLSVDLSGLKKDGNLTSANMKDISSEATVALENAALKLKRSVEAGNLSVVVEGETLLPKPGSFVTSEIRKTCSEGQAVKNNLCGKYH